MAAIPHTSRERTYALAAIYQVTMLVDELAHQGQANAEEIEAVLSGLFVMNPEETFAVYGEPQLLLKGLKMLRGDFSKQDSETLYNATRYALMLIGLEKQLTRNRGMLATLATELEGVKRQIDHFSLLHETVLSRLDQIYQQTLSTIHPRIIVKGSNHHLARPENAARIRALLLAGVRAVVLWRQCRGNRFQLIFGRGKLVAEAAKMVAETEV
ncbi:MAG: high frequency lysogenization protein HflD [Gammaproteobacteria bacterium]|nr:high frequency lysogenization protein HflD [Gammaproteobacteria bacterium]